MLTKSQQVYRTTNKIDDLDARNDFGSYRRVLLGDNFKSAGIALHNDLEPLRKVQSIRKYLKIKENARILDAGCGLGFTTDAIAASFPRSSVLGIDISIDAIEFASKRFTTASFLARPIDPESDPIGLFDLIFCFEFYPFTRNRNVHYQSQMIRYLAQNLTPSGQLVISQTWREVDGLPFIYQQVVKQCDELNFTSRKVPHPKLPSRIPRGLVLIAAWMGQVVTQRELVKNIVIVSNKTN